MSKAISILKFTLWSLVLSSNPAIAGAPAGESAATSCVSQPSSHFLAKLGRWLIPRGKTPMSVEDPACKTDPKDPFEIGYRIAWGPNKGTCVDTSRRRYIQKLTPQQSEAYGGAQNSYLIANFRHNDQFWIARIPKGEIVQDVTGEKVRYFLGQSHVQVRFKLKPGSEIKLYPQSGANLSKPLKINDISWSSSSAQLKGQAEQSPLGGLLIGNDAAVNMLMSHDQRLTEEPGRRYTQHKIEVDPKTARAWIDTGIEQSEKEGFQGRITLLNKNCINGFFRMMDQTPEIAQGRQGGRPHIPKSFYGELKRRGIESEILPDIYSPPLDASKKD